MYLCIINLCDLEEDQITANYGGSQAFACFWFLLIIHFTLRLSIMMPSFFPNISVTTLVSGIG